MRGNRNGVVLFVGLMAGLAFLVHLKGYGVGGIVGFFAFFIVLVVLNVAGNMVADRMDITDRLSRRLTVYGTVFVGVLFLAAIVSMVA